jgi:CubicO group peptidase (beta-lactamase class C family)/beta-glucosidase-like glycosyl hydrolase
LRNPERTPLRPRAARLIAAAALVLLSACADEEPRSPWTEARLARMTVRQKAAQLVVARAHAPADTAVRRLARAGVGGVEPVGRPAASAAALLRALRRESPLPPLVLARVDGGRVSADAPEAPSLPGLLLAGDAAAARAAGELAGAEAKALGVDLLLLPGPPLPSEDPAALPVPVTRAAQAAFAAYLEAVRGSGVLAGVTAFAPPGGAGREAPLVRWDAAALEVAQVEPLREAILEEGALAAVAPALAAVPALTGDSTPLPFSGVFTHAVLRRDLGFGGVIVADVAPGSPLARRYGAFPAALAALRAGADVVAGVTEPDAMIDSIAAAVADGRFPRARLDAAVRRVFAVKERAGLGITPADTSTAAPAVRTTETVAKAAAAHRRTVRVLGAAPGEALAGCRRTVVAAHPRAADAVRPLWNVLAMRTPGMLALYADTVPGRGPLSRLPDFAGNGADCVVAVSFPGAPVAVAERVVPALDLDTAGVRADTARARILAAIRQDTARRRVVAVLLAPEPGEALPDAQSLVLAWGTGAEAQGSAAEAVAGPDRSSAGDEDEREPLPMAWPAVPVLARAAPREAGMSADSLAKIDAALRRALADGVFTGAVVLVGRRGRIVKATGYGRTSGVPVDPGTTEFDIASLTKVVGTTAAIMALVEDGEVALEAPVRRYVPQFRGSGKGGVTIRHLLTHTSGLPAGADLYGETQNAEEALERVYRTRLVSDPGERVVYSDFGMILLAEVVRRRAGEPVDRFLARRVFVPLGMARTMYTPPAAMQPATVPTAIRSERPYVLDGVVHDGNAFRLGGVAGHAGLFSTAGDLAVYAQALLSGGSYGARRIWGPQTVRRFTTRAPNAGTRTPGWDTPARTSSASDWFSARSFGHTGYTGTSLWIDPERGIFVVLLTNRTYDRGTARQILEVRSAVHAAAARSVTDAPVRPRPGTRAAEIEAERERAKRRPRPRPRRPTRPRGRRG